MNSHSVTGSESDLRESGEISGVLTLDLSGH